MGQEEEKALAPKPGDTKVYPTSESLSPVPPRPTPHWWEMCACLFLLERSSFPGPSHYKDRVGTPGAGPVQPLLPSPRSNESLSRATGTSLTCSLPPSPT